MATPIQKIAAYYSPIVQEQILARASQKSPVHELNAFFDLALPQATAHKEVVMAMNNIQRALVWAFDQLGITLEESEGEVAVVFSADKKAQLKGVQAELLRSSEVVDALLNLTDEAQLDASVYEWLDLANEWLEDLLNLTPSDLGSVLVDNYEAPSGMKAQIITQTGQGQTERTAARFGSGAPVAKTLGDSRTIQEVPPFIKDLGPELVSNYLTVLKREGNETILQFVEANQIDVNDVLPSVAIAIEPVEPLNRRYLTRLRQIIHEGKKLASELLDHPIGNNPEQERNFEIKILQLIAKHRLHRVNLSRNKVDRQLIYLTGEALGDEPIQIPAQWLQLAKTHMTPLVFERWKRVVKTLLSRFGVRAIQRNFIDQPLKDLEEERRVSYEGEGNVRRELHRLFFIQNLARIDIYASVYQFNSVNRIRLTFSNLRDTWVSIIASVEAQARFIASQEGVSSNFINTEEFQTALRRIYRKKLLFRKDAQAKFVREYIDKLKAIEDPSTQTTQTAQTAQTVQTVQTVQTSQTSQTIIVPSQYMPKAEAADDVIQQGVSVYLRDVLFSEEDEVWKTWMSHLNGIHDEINKIVKIWSSQHPNFVDGDLSKVVETHGEALQNHYQQAQTLKERIVTALTHVSQMISDSSSLGLTKRIQQVLDQTREKITMLFSETDNVFEPKGLPYLLNTLIPDLLEHPETFSVKARGVKSIHMLAQYLLWNQRITYQSINKFQKILIQNILNDLIQELFGLLTLDVHSYRFFEDGNSQVEEILQDLPDILATYRQQVKDYGLSRVSSFLVSALNAYPDHPLIPLLAMGVFPHDIDTGMRQLHQAYREVWAKIEENIPEALRIFPLQTRKIVDQSIYRYLVKIRSSLKDKSHFDYRQEILPLLDPSMMKVETPKVVVDAYGSEFSHAPQRWGRIVRYLGMTYGDILRESYFYPGQKQTTEDERGFQYDKDPFLEVALMGLDITQQAFHGSKDLAQHSMKAKSHQWLEKRRMFGGLALAAGIHQEDISSDSFQSRLAVFISGYHPVTETIMDEALVDARLREALPIMKDQLLFTPRKLDSLFEDFRRLNKMLKDYTESRSTDDQEYYLDEAEYFLNDIEGVMRNLNDALNKLERQVKVVTSQVGSLQDNIAFLRKFFADLSGVLQGYKTHLTGEKRSQFNVPSELLQLLGSSSQTAATRKINLIYNAFSSWLMSAFFDVDLSSSARMGEIPVPDDAPVRASGSASVSSGGTLREKIDFDVKRSENEPHSLSSGIDFLNVLPTGGVTMLRSPLSFQQRREPGDSIFSLDSRLSGSDNQAPTTHLLDGALALKRKPEAIDNGDHIEYDVSRMVPDKAGEDKLIEEALSGDPSPFLDANTMRDGGAVFSSVKLTKPGVIH